MAKRPLTYRRPSELQDATAAFRTLGYKSVEFYEVPSAKVRYELRGSIVEPVTAGDRSYSAIALMESQGMRFWLSAYLEFSISGRTSTFDSGGVIVLAGTLASEAREVFRAEWDPHAIDHAQPHWHVYGSELLEKFRMAGQVERSMDASLSIEMELSRFHFAMCARWMDANGGENISPGQGSVARWMLRCIQYSLRQLKYLCRRGLALREEAEDSNQALF